MRSADQVMGEGADSCHGNRNARTEDEVVLAGAETGVAASTYASGAGEADVFVPVVATQVSYDSYEWEELSFQRSIPTIEIGAAGGVGVQVGVSKENISALSESGQRQAKN